MIGWRKGVLGEGRAGPVRDVDRDFDKWVDDRVIHELTPLFVFASRKLLGGNNLEREIISSVLAIPRNVSAEYLDLEDVVSALAEQFFVRFT